MPKTATKPTKKTKIISKKNVAAKPEKKVPGKNTFQAIADHVGARIADLADEVFAANPDATLDDLWNELDMLQGALGDFIEYGFWDRQNDNEEEGGVNTLLAALR